MRDSRRTRTIVGLLLLVSLTLVVLSLRGGDSSRSGASGLFAPVENAAASIVAPVRNFFSSIGGIGSKDQQIADLQAKIDALQTEANKSDYDRNRAAEIDALLKLAGKGQYRVVPAQVIAFGPAQGFAWTVTIDAGRKDGLKIDQNVVNGQGLVGRVVAVTDSTATVVLLVDSTATVGARVESSLEVGFLNGTGDSRTLELQLLDPLRAGGRGQSTGLVRRQGRCLRPGHPARDDHRGARDSRPANPHRIRGALRRRDRAGPRRSGGDRAAHRSARLRAAAGPDAVTDGIPLGLRIGIPVVVGLGIGLTLAQGLLRCPGCARR